MDGGCRNQSGCVEQTIELGPGIERIAGFVRGAPFGKHRHEGFVVGVTTAGVQHFTYRRRQWHAPAGQFFLLPPDEVHDGSAGTTDGVAYSAVHIDSDYLQKAGSGLSLARLTNPLIATDQLQKQSFEALWRHEEAWDEAEILEALVSLIDLFGPADQTSPLPMAKLGQVRESIRATPQRQLPLSALEEISGLDRWSLARSFRKAFGVSPTRYRTLRQLALARALILEGESLAAVASDAGFADQSHMSRKFRSAFGIPPGRWRSATSLAHNRSI